MTHEEQTAFGLMTKQERARWLLQQGVYTQADIDPDAIDLGFYAFSAGCKIIGAGKHATEAAAIDAGEAYLKQIAEQTQPEPDHA